MSLKKVAFWDWGKEDFWLFLTENEISTLCSRRTSNKMHFNESEDAQSKR